MNWTLYNAIRLSRMDTSLVSVHKWPFSAIPRRFRDRFNHAKGGQACGIACAAYTRTPPHNSLISLNLQKIAHF
jgi:hypothetical protein